jgi:hypothetical protein
MGWKGNIRFVVPGTPAAKMDSSFTYVHMYIHFSSKFEKIASMLLAWLPHALM